MIDPAAVKTPAAGFCTTTTCRWSFLQRPAEFSEIWLDDLDCHPALVNASFTDNSQIEVTFNEELGRNQFEIKPGSNIVFNLIIKKAQCEALADDESSQFLHFEIQECSAI